MSLTKIASEVTEEDKIGCLVTRGHADGTVTLYYEGDDIPEVQYAPGALPTEDQF
jgi:hypothetical protein